VNDAIADLDMEVARQKKSEEALTRIAAAKARMILNKDPRFAFFVCKVLHHAGGKLQHDD